MTKRTERLSIEGVYDSFHNRGTTLYFLRTGQEKLLIATVTVQYQQQTSMDILLDRVKLKKGISVQIEPHLAGAALDALVDYLTIRGTNSIISEDSQLREAERLSEVAEALTKYAVRAAALQFQSKERAA